MLRENFIQFDRIGGFGGGMDHKNVMSYDADVTKCEVFAETANYGNTLTSSAIM